MNKIDRKIWDAVTRQVGEDDIETREDYSGRGMFGDRCIAVVGNERDLLRFVGLLVSWCDDTDDAADTIEGLAQSVLSDGMGTQAIYYFPGWTVAE